MEAVMNFNPRYPAPSPEVQEKLRLSIQAAEALETRYMLCPVCNFKVRKILVTQTEVVFVKCQKCKFEGVLSPAYFRTLRRRRTRLSDTRRKRMIRKPIIEYVTIRLLIEQAEPVFDRDCQAPYEARL